MRTFAILTSIVFLLLQFFATSNSLSRNCDSAESTCTKLSTCPPLLKLLSPPLDPNKLRTLQEATCDTSGNEPKVCCPSPKKPEPEPDPPTTPPSISLTDKILNHPNLKLLPNSEKCGKPGSFDPFRITGGVDAGLGTHPWMVLIGFTFGGDSKVLFACGGTLINSNYILTAAHCVAGLPAGLVPKIIRIGEYNTSSDLDCVDTICAPKVQDIPVEDVMAHETYDVTGKKENDIALIRLKSHAALGPFVAPICLPHGERVEKFSQRPFVAGWGRTTADNPDNSIVLQQVSVAFQNFTVCNNVYSATLEGAVDDGRFCAGGEKGKDSCKGDSGGPLLIGVKVRGQLRVFQFGIVSLGPKDCDTSIFPALYTKVSYFMPWILDHLKP